MKNNEGKIIYFIDVNGNVIDFKGNKLGMVKKNGLYYNIKGENVFNVGKIEGEKCEIMDLKGYNMGIVYKNYKFYVCVVYCLLME